MRKLDLKGATEAGRIVDRANRYHMKLQEWHRKNNEAEESARGDKIADFLLLKPALAARSWKTKWGTKTSLDLFLIIERLIHKGE